MPSQESRDQNSTEQPDNSTSQLEDLQQSDVTEQEAAQVKGGLNPQPLPPGHADSHIS